MGEDCVECSGGWCGREKDERMKKKKKKVKGTYVEEVVGKKRKEGNKEKQIKGTCVE